MVDVLTPRIGAAALAVTLAAVLATGCDDRDPTNPFDPDNPDTGGLPDWLEAVADDGAVDLSWRVAPARGFDTYEIARAEVGGAFGVLERISTIDTVSFRDEGVTNGRAYTYRLTVTTADEERLELPSKPAQPGSFRPWVVENGGFGLVRTSPDARHVRVRTGSFSGFFDAVPADSGRVWGADYAGDRLLLYSEDGDVEREIDIDLPYRMTVDVERGIVWAAKWPVGEPAELFAFDADGDELDRVVLPNEIRDLEIDPVTGACVGALGRAGGVFRYAIGDSLERTATHGEYMMLEVMSDGTLVAADPFTDRMVRFDTATLAPVDSVDVDDTPLALHAAGETLWAAVGSEWIRAYDGAFSMTREVEGVGPPTSLAYDPEADAVWVALPTRGRVTRLDLDGDERVDQRLFDPFLVVLASR